MFFFEHIFSESVGATGNGHGDKCSKVIKHLCVTSMVYL